MQFRTQVSPSTPFWQITHSSTILSVGSCFADCIGTRMQDMQFKAMANPFGIIYNPISLFNNIFDSLNDAPIDKSLIVRSKEVFFHYQFHSEVFGDSIDELEERIAQRVKLVKDLLYNVDCIVITFGTAFVYHLKESDVSVSNCHKMPGDLFLKQMLTVEDITSSFEKLVEKLDEINPKGRIILTVSPVRHLKDTLELNNVSKSVLRIASETICQKYRGKVHYFPSFEIMMDDLRDYRFYKEDMIHPSIQAEEYIWEKFSETFFPKSTIEVNKEITDILAGLAHRPFHPQSAEYALFLEKLDKRVKNLHDKIPVHGLLQKMALKLDR